MAYAVGLITTDGNLSSNGKNIIFTSQDLELIRYVQLAFKLNASLGITRNKKSESYRVQLSSVQLYDWLLSVGLTSKKSLTIKEIAIPNEYFIDFLRGHLDGDGSITTFVDKYNAKVDPKYIYNRLFTKFISASSDHMEWLQKKVIECVGVHGALHKTKPNHIGNSIYVLKFGKKESLKLLNKLYYNDKLPCLTRKKIIYIDFLKTL